MRGYLKKVLEYADNPDKTTEKKYLDDDLYAALRYTENDDKTDERKYVSGINCSAAFAYQEMMAVKRKYGERGKVIAYHGYQSFKTGELTPEQAHEIGLEAARRMWGKDFQVLVTTHLNTDNIHCHFVINSVSFRDGHKYRNSIEQHRDLREISDAICTEHGLSVLTDAPFYGGLSRQAYRKSQRDGKPTHREQLKADIEYCLRYSIDWDTFIRQLEAKGYSIDPVRMSVKAENWQRAVRLNRMGFTDEVMYEQWDRNEADPEFRYRVQDHRPHISKSGVLL
ncbi:MAG: relaxase/mobilization nuclease domain-containing protein, partial [Oscillospiraceae bacterium]|nr:relaxase/mobilization nuclease domain-containing protein [Oscillospiraceae bacterium]